MPTVDLSMLVTAAAKQESLIVALKLNAIRTLNETIEAFGRAVTGDVPEIEKISWPTKDIAARRYLAGQTSPSDDDHQMLVAESEKTGETLTALAMTIVGQSILFRHIMSTLTGIRREARDEINAAAGEAGIMSALETGLSRIETLRQSLV